MKHQNKGVDPALCLYVGAYLLCTLDNKFLREKVPRGNGTLCRLVSMKLKDSASTHIKNYYGKKVWNVCAKDVEWIECKHSIKTDAIHQLDKKISDLQNKKESSDENTAHEIDAEIKQAESKLFQLCKTRRFKIEPKHYSNVQVAVKPHPLARTTDKFKCNMTKLPINLNDASTFINYKVFQKT